MINYIDFAKDTALEAGKIIIDGFRSTSVAKYKANESPLTIFDEKVNALVLNRVKRFFPNHNILSEENSALTSSSDYLWVCDPIDGTIPFLAGLPTFAFSLALLKEKKVILGVIYDPFMDRMYFAEKGRGAKMNEKNIHVSSRRDLRHSSITVCWWRTSKYDLYLVDKRLRDLDIYFIDPTSIVYTGALVALGKMEATIFGGNDPHDSAALKIIIEEARGKVTDLFGFESYYGSNIEGHLATNGLLHNKLLKLIRENIKKV